MAINVPRRIMPALVCSLLCVCCWHGTAAGMGNITAVQVMPNMRGIIIRCDGSLGKHTTAVFQQPSRLVVDFETTMLGKVPTRIRVNEDPIQEIRLGYSNSRARVVVDFGNRPVPRFKVEQGHSMMVIALDKGVPMSAQDRVTSAAGAASVPAEAFRAPPLAPTTPQAPAAARPVAPAHSASPTPAHHAAPRAPALPKSVSGSPVMVKTSGIKENLVFVELADRKNPKRSCRLVIDLDPASFHVRNVTLSDVEGNLKLFQVAETAAPRVTEVSPRTGVGPRRMSASASGAASPVKKKLQWGTPAAQPGQEQDPRLRGAPGRLQEFHLRPR